MSFQTLPSLADILAADRQLACEVEYDLRMFENQQTEDAEQAPANPAQVPGCKQLGGGGGSFMVPFNVFKYARQHFSMFSIAEIVCQAFK